MFASNVKINKRKTWAFNRKYGFEKLSRKKKEAKYRIPSWGNRDGKLRDIWKRESQFLM